jgi:hypothetical protein
MKSEWTNVNCTVSPYLKSDTQYDDTVYDDYIRIEISCQTSVE